jgi:hypothetical protein
MVILDFASTIAWFEVNGLNRDIEGGDEFFHFRHPEL